MEQVRETIPLVGGKEIAWTASLQSCFSHDWYDGVAHLLTVRLTDTLVREELRYLAVKKVERLFTQLLDIAQPAPRLIAELDSMKIRGTGLAMQHLQANPVTEWSLQEDSDRASHLHVDSDRGRVVVRAPGFESVPTSLFAALEPSDD